MKFAARVTLPCTISKIVQLSLCIYKSATTCWLHYTVTHVLSSFIMAFHYKTLHTIHLILIQYLPIIRQDLLCNKILSAYCCFECGYRNMYCKLWYCKQEVSFYASHSAANGSTKPRVWYTYGSSLISTTISSIIMSLHSSNIHFF